MMEMKPCPFCGKQPLLMGGYQELSYAFFPYWVQCGNDPEKCNEFPVTDSFRTKEEAIEAWNQEEFDID